MSKFIKLTQADEKQVFVNVEQIQMISHCDGGSVIHFQEGRFVFSKEEPERIIKLIQTGTSH